MKNLQLSKYLLQIKVGWAASISLKQKNDSKQANDNNFQNTPIIIVIVIVYP